MTNSWKSRRNPSGCARKFCKPTSVRAAGRKFALAKRPQFDCAVFSLRWFFEQFRQVLLPQGGARMRAVAARFIADGKQNEARILYSLDFAFGHAQLGRIDKVVRGID